jgi:hypothetical protein
MREGSILSAVVWMTILSLLLFWLPVIGPLIAGFVGGRKAGTVGNAIIAVFVPGILAAVVMFLGIGLLSGMPLIGAIAGMGALVAAGLHIGPLLVGAIVGGAT